LSGLSGLERIFQKDLFESARSASSAFDFENRSLRGLAFDNPPKPIYTADHSNFGLWHGAPGMVPGRFFVPLYCEGEKIMAIIANVQLKRVAAAPTQLSSQTTFAAEIVARFPFSCFCCTPCCTSCCC
jgi:hypothetical protein